MSQNIFDKWRKCWVRYLLGSNWKPDTKDGQQIIASLNFIADAGESGGMHADPSHVGYMSPLLALRSRAIRWRTLGSKTFGCDEELHSMLCELERIGVEYYNLETSDENWWAVEIGEPLRLLDILFLLYEQLPTREKTIAKWTDVILHFQNAYQTASNGQIETGANLMWKCHIQLLTGILRQDRLLIDWANKQLPTILEYASVKKIPGMGKIYEDGFYPDGSFIQHYFFAYTGGYGKHLLSIYAGLVYAFSGEECLSLSEEKQAFFYHMIRDAYVPLLVDGHFMDLARGRETSRSYLEDDVCARIVLRALCYLRQIAPNEEKRYLTAFLKQQFMTPGVRDSLLVDKSPFAEYYVQPSLAEVLAEIEADSTQPLIVQPAHYNFGAMCKAVHRTPKWSVGIGMYNKTIACYEALNGESIGLWHFSDGVTWLYTADAAQYSNHYYATVDRQRLPGTTVDRSPSRAAEPYYAWYMPESKNVYDFAGGCTLSEYGTACLQYRGQGNEKERDLEVKKSWFFLGEEIVCLGSGITSTTGHPIETIIDNRRLLADSGNMLTVDNAESVVCKELMGTNNVFCLKTVHLTGNNGKDSGIGYYFPNETKVQLLIEHRIGSWNQMKIDDNPQFRYENNFATLWLAHGKFPMDASYSYVILPAKSAKYTQQYANTPAIEILANTSSVHAVHHKNTHITAVHFLNDEKNTAAGITCNTQSCVMIQTNDNVKIISVSDPTQNDCSIELIFDFNVKDISYSDSGIQVLSLSPLHIKVDTTDANGKSKSIFVSLS